MEDFGYPRFLPAHVFHFGWAWRWFASIRKLGGELPIVPVDAGEGVDTPPIPSPEDILPRTHRFDASVAEAAHLGVDHLRGLP
jgi:hypothetical protein